MGTIFAHRHTQLRRSKINVVDRGKSKLSKIKNTNRKTHPRTRHAHVGVSEALAQEGYSIRSLGKMQSPEQQQRFYARMKPHGIRGWADWGDESRGTVGCDREGEGEGGGG